MTAFKPVGKKTLLAASALAMAASAFAAGPKDGIYVLSPPSPAADAQEYLTLHTNSAGAVVAGIYRSRAADTPNRWMGRTVYGMEGGTFNTSTGAATDPGTVQGHMFRWSWWDSLSGTITNDVATLTGTSNHVGCTATVTVYLDGVQPTMTMASTISDFAKEQIRAGIRATYGSTIADTLIANIRSNAAVTKQTEECAKPTYNYTTNLTKWF